MTGGNFGLQAGIQATDVVLVFTDEDAVKGLLRGKLTLNGTASASGGPVGRDAQAGIDILMSSPILAFSRSKGVFAGIALDGSVVTIDDSSNQKVYGKFVTGTDILRLRRVAPNDVVDPFMASLKSASPSGEPTAATTADTTADATAATN
jgi:lipid-binding SYLF domain-containing protein